MAAIRRLLFIVALIGASYHIVECADNTCKETWKEFTDAITSGSKQDFVNYVSPLATMAKLTYTGKTSDIIPGWNLVQEFKLLSGLYALAYQCESDPNKVVLAFRGIRFGDKEFKGMGIDLCARFALIDAGLECSDDKKGLPQTCDWLQGWVIDYLNQARVFVDQLRASYPDECFLYTGHSLGASLAAILSATSGKFQSHAVAFASNPSNVPEILANLGVDDADYSRVITLFDKYDNNVDLNDSKNGVRCRFEGQEPDVCATCTADGPSQDISKVLQNMESPCGKCLHLTHGLSHMLTSIYANDTQRPQCYQQDWVQIPFSQGDLAQETVQADLAQETDMAEDMALELKDLAQEDDTAQENDMTERRLLNLLLKALEGQ